MANGDVIVSISDASAEVSSTDYSKILVVSDDKVLAYKEYDLSGGISASGIATDYPITTDTYKKVLAIAAQTPAPQIVGVIGCSAGVITTPALTVILNELLLTVDNFFRVVTTYDTTTLRLDIAKWAEVNGKFAYIQYADTTFTDDYTTTAARIILHKTANEHADAAEAGYAATRTPGTFIFKFKEIKELTPQSLTAAEKTAVDAKNMGYYAKVSGLNMERSSKASNWSSSKPLYIDDLESRAYIMNEMQNKLLTLMVNTAKVPGDINGIQMIDSVVSGVLQNAYDDNIVASKDDGTPDFNTDVSKAKFIKASRQWTAVNFNYAYLHGTEKITVPGTVR